MKTSNYTFMNAIKIMIVLLAFTFSTTTYAVSGNYKGGPKKNKDKYPPGDTPGQGGDSVPLDGGLGILLVGAAAFGVKKLREGKNDQA